MRITTELVDYTPATGNNMRKVVISEDRVVIMERDRDKWDVAFSTEQLLALLKAAVTK